MRRKGIGDGGWQVYPVHESNFSSLLSAGDSRPHSSGVFVSSNSRPTSKTGSIGRRSRHSKRFREFSPKRRRYHSRECRPCLQVCDSFRCARDRKSTRLNSSHVSISYAVFCLKKKKKQI